MNRRAQAAIEFLILLGFMVLVFTTFLVVVKERSAENRERALQNDLSTVAAIIQQEVTMAHRVRGGYYRTFELPASINDGEYNITLYPAIAPSEVVIRGGEFEYILFLPVNLSPYSNISPGANMISKNDQGNISIGPAGNCVHQIDCSDGLACTTDACVHGSCTFADTCGKEQTCTESGCDCKTGTNDIMAAGADGMDWANGGGARSRVKMGDANVCCAVSECPWTDGLCYGIGARVQYRLWTCEDVNTNEVDEPTIYKCAQQDQLHNGSLLVVGMANYCCSQYSENPPRVPPRWGFNSTPTDLKREDLGVGCTDGHDNDCNGLVDCADPACASLCGSTCDLTAPTNIKATTSGISLSEWYADITWTPGGPGVNDDVQHIYVGTSEAQVNGNCEIVGCLLQREDLPTTQAKYPDVKDPQLAVDNGQTYWVRVVNYRDASCWRDASTSFTVGGSCTVGASCNPPTGGTYDAACACACAADQCTIKGVCYADGASNPSVDCQYCNVRNNPLDWSTRTPGTSCSPPTGGTYDAACACACAADQCTINGVCYANGADNPGNDCQYCDTTKTKIAWSDKADLTLCTDDGLFCTLNVCAGGMCTSRSRPCPKGQTCNEFLDRCV